MKKIICGKLICLIILLTILAVSTFAQTRPSWARGVKELPIDYNECVSRAKNALESEGYTLENQGGMNSRDYYFNASKDIHSAVIACNQSPNGKFWINVFVASLTDNPNLPSEERWRLLEKMEGSVAMRCGLGKWWEEEEAGWKSIWTRKGDSDIFEASYTGPNGERPTTTNSVNLQGDRVYIQRTSSSVGNLCSYEGTIQSDGTTIKGTYTCPVGGTRNWSAKIKCN